MDKPDTTVKIQTLGRFSITVDGRPVATDWPNETLKVLFCSLLSPLDLYIMWDRLCRSMWDVPVSRSRKQRLEDHFIKPLKNYLIMELGFNPLLERAEGISIDQQRIQIDAVGFYNTVLEGLRMFSLANHSAALEIFNSANLLYTGSYLQGIPGKIISSSRNELESLYRTAVLDAIPQALNHGVSSNGPLHRCIEESLGSDEAL